MIFQIIMIGSLVIAVRLYLAGCDFFVGPEDKWDEPSPFEKWRNKK